MKDLNKWLVREVKLLKKAAVAGYAFAQYRLGDSYYLGKGVKKDIAAAIKWYRKAAQQGDLPVLCELANAYYTGSQGMKCDEDKALTWYHFAAMPTMFRGSQFNSLSSEVCIIGDSESYCEDNEAIEWITKAADQGRADAQCFLGRVFQEGLSFSGERTFGITCDRKRAAEYFLTAAKRGYSDAQYLIGLAYWRGDGVRKHSRAAFQWLRKAAEQGHSLAQNILGSVFRHKNRIKYSSEEAVNWLRQSAEQGNGHAQGELGYILRFGHGVPVNVEEALTWCRKAVSNQNPYAEECLIIGYFTLTPPPEETYPAEIKWHHKAAIKGDVVSQRTLGCAYAFGDIVEKDMAKAVKWLGKAAMQGVVDAQKFISNDYFKSQYIDIGYAEACFEYCRVIAFSQNLLGDLYFKGEGVKRDYAKAIKLYRKAAAFDDNNAKAKLRNMYVSGKGVRADLKKAYGWHLLSGAGHTDDCEGDVNARQTLEKEITPAQKKGAQTWAKKWKPKISYYMVRGLDDPACC